MIHCHLQALRGILAISQPLRGGAVQDWDDLEAVWQHVYSRYSSFNQVSHLLNIQDTNNSMLNRELGVSASDLPALVRTTSI